MGFADTIFRWLRIVVVAILILGGVYWALNSYLATTSPNGTAVSLAATSAFASMLFVLAMFIVVTSALQTMNNHLEHLSDAADEQVKLLRYQIRLAQQVNKKELLLNKQADEFPNT